MSELQWAKREEENDESKVTCLEGMNCLIILEGLHMVSAPGEKGPDWGPPIGKIREEAEARSQGVFQAGQCCVP